MRFGSLFSGAGGMDLGLELAGIKCCWQVENNKNARIILERHWPGLLRPCDIRDTGELPRVELVAGGDPCPVRSRARAHRPSRHPDLAGYFLAVVARLRLRWMVRENVPAPDAKHFVAAMELLGYRTVALEIDSRDFTGQSRRRQFLCGCLDHGAAIRFEQCVSGAADGSRFVPSRSEEKTPLAACLTAHHGRMAAEDTYCFEPSRGLRVLTSEERESLQGFPRGWTDGLSRSVLAKLTGNAVTVPVARWIGLRIMEANLSPPQEE